MAQATRVVRVHPYRLRQPRAKKRPWESKVNFVATIMGKQEKLLEQLSNASQDANWNFQDITGLLHRLGWEMRIRGSHHFFRKTGVRDIINLQPAGAKAKSYQVRQFRNVLQSLGVL